jgi:nucleotide-binding universal stress UspA family protein
MHRDVEDDEPGPATGRRLRVLVSSDGSEGAVAAGRFAARLLPRGSAVVRLLTVLSEELYPYGPFGERLTDADERLARIGQEEEDACGELARLLEANGHAVTIAHRFGQAATEVLYDAAEWSPDLVVAGRRGRGRTGLAMGSVSQRLLHHAQCALLILP